MSVLIEHPSKGKMLFDTGYGQQIATLASHLPYSLYRLITPIHMDKGDPVKQQLQTRGIYPQEVSTIFISHFHADHIGGLQDFPNSTLIYAQSAYRAVKDLHGLAAVRKAFIPELLPIDFEERSKPINDSLNPICPTRMSAFPAGYDLWNDGSVVAISLPGHAEGQMGLYLPDTTEGPMFLVADACWHSRAIREQVLPHPIARLVLDDYSAYCDTLKRLGHVHRNSPEVLLIPTHCQEVWKKFSSSR